MRNFNPTSAQRRCLIAATVAPRSKFRKGFASSKFGPFYAEATVLPLLRTGALRTTSGRRGFMPLTVSAVADGTPHLIAAE